MSQCSISQVTKEEMLRPKNRYMEYPARASKSKRHEPTERHLADKGENPTTTPEVTNEEVPNPMNGSKQARPVENQPTDSYSVKLDDFLVQEELDHEGSEEEYWETRTVRFVKEERSVNNNDTKRKRRPWQEVASEAKGNLSRTEEKLKKKDNNGNEGYEWLSDESMEFDTRYGEISSDDNI